MKKIFLVTHIYLFILLFSVSFAHAQQQFPDINTITESRDRNTEPKNKDANARFIEGEIIVKYKDKQAPEDIKQEVTRRAAVKNRPIIGGIQIALENAVLQVQGEKKPEENLQDITRVDKQAGTKKIETVFKNTTLQEDHPFGLDDIKLIKTDNKKSVEELKKIYESIPEVEYAVPNNKNEILATPNDTFYNYLWGFNKIQMPQAWDITTGSTNVIVAVIDTGIYYDHPDLAGKVVGGFDYYYGDPDPIDYFGHGTHVAGTIGAIANNNRGVAGINWNIKLFALKVFSDNPAIDPNAYDQDIVNAIVDAAANGAKVINLSLGSKNACNKLYTDAISYARSKGATIVVAAGNDNADASQYSPASCAGVIAVGATGPNDQRSSYSNYGSIVDIAAPGGEVVIGQDGKPTCPTDPMICIFSTYTFIQSNGQRWVGYAPDAGTSMAAPHVSGVAALLLAKNPNLTPDQIENIIKNTGDPITTDRPIGGKRLNAYKALLSILPPTATPTLTNTPTPQPTNTPTPTQTPTPSPTPTITPTLTPSPTPTNTPTPTATATPTPRPTNTPTPTITPTATPTNSPTPTPTLTNTPTPQPTNTPTPIPPTPTPTPIPGDIDGDGHIDIIDFNVWLCEFLGDGICTAPPSNRKADINKDNTVDLLDFVLWRNAFIQ